MPVEPIPCAPGGGTGTPGDCACAPSIASAPLCRADGSTVLVVLRSGCVDCSATPGDPEAIGWVDPLTGAFTAGPVPPDAGPCSMGCSCSPSIATTPMCRADGSTVLVVVRSDCVDCDTAAPDPVVVGWIDPATGVFTPGVPPADAGACEPDCVTTVCRQRCDDTDGDGEANTTYSELWCIRADGSAELLLTYQDDPATPYTPVAPVDCTYGCPETETLQLCDDSGPFLRRYTWLNGVASFEDFALDGQTAHIVQGTVGVCAQNDDADCLDTVCRQRCDDTDGDGQADTTYSELWCIAADGAASLLLTYQDDPASPYTPVAPVDCEYGSEATQALTLCDDSGPFLRRYSWLAGSASFEDVELDGATPHIVQGAVGLCPAAPACEEQTTPAATLGLCLADGTPIAVLVTRDCDGQVTQDGWLNLTTGAYSVGDPPAGTMACGNPRSITTAGTFCDIDPDTGDVYGLVLIEYTYGPDGEVAAVRLVDATTGQTYVPQGQVTTCPVGVEQPERDLVQLCDTAPDGAVTPFVRDYARDENGAITGHSDYTLDGAPYAPTGTVGQCADQCQDCQSIVLCDTVGGDPVAIAGPAASGTLSNGVGYAVTAPSPFAPNRQSDGAAWWDVPVFPNPVVPVTRWTFDQPVNVDFSVALMWSTATTPGTNQVQVPPGAMLLSLPAGYSYNRTTGILSVDNTLTACTLNQPTRATSARFRLVGVTTFTLQYLGNRVVNAPCQRLGHWEFGAVDVSLGGQFLRTVCRDCTGVITTTTDTLLDGETPYTPLGLVGVCSTSDGGDTPGEPVERDTEVVQLCDQVDDADPVPFLRALTYPAGGGTPTVTDTTLDGITPYTVTGTVGLCSPHQECQAQTLLQECRCDDSDGDGLPDTDYVELLGVDCTGTLTSLGTYLPDLSAPYAPVAPLSCEEPAEGADPAFGVQARRLELAAGGDPWDAAAFPTLQSVTAVAFGGTGTVTTTDGTSTLHAGEAVTWSVGRDADAALTGPLLITADTGTVTVTWTQGVTLS
ncbi:hypothetical protein [Streptomyces sp. KAU_LT]|uniref:hypothetical protein n=1 Tax=Streptomyces sp. KAU_LT TaxID=3046669 RepID=UPI0024B65674|nr:hypothetical protein [Streptomyces sp. KAU_LT]MDI9829691.1 hypothetical protein [Streptomyces sp. KAU_LT]